MSPRGSVTAALCFATALAGYALLPKLLPAPGNLPGGALGTGADSDVTSATVLVMKDSFDVGMDMLADVIRRPAFAPEEIERQRRQTI